MITVVDAKASDLSEVLSLNQSEVPHVGEVTMARLQSIVDQAAHFQIAQAGGQIAGFILALDQNARYDSMNFQWFKERYPRFMYVDRIAVASDFRKQGVGRALYKSVEDRSRDYPLIACEVNLRPPNPDSMSFHERLGFKQVGKQDTEGGTKTVAMLLRSIEPPGR